MHIMADAAATLGGRFNLIFNPHDACVYHNAYGEFCEQALDLMVGVRTPEGVTWALPFTARAERLPYLEQFDTLTTIEYRGVQPDLGFELTMRIRSPFYPRNIGISTAPFHYVDIEVRRLGGFRFHQPESPMTCGELVFALAGAGVAFAATDGGFSYTFESTTGGRGDSRPRPVPVTSWIESADAEVFLGGSALRMPFDLGEEPSASMSLLWSSWAEGPVLEVFGERTPFKYQQIFDSREEMAQWGIEERERIEARCDLLDETVQDWSLGRAHSDMCALALHTYLVNSWWTVCKDGSDWFSIWEGNCFFHSTLDVEYNAAMLYLALWPELLEMLLEQWTRFEVDGAESLGTDAKGTSFLCHDMGADAVVGRQAYDHHMEVEENANYLLLLAAWTAFTGNLKIAAKKLPLCKRLAEFIVRADTSGNGVPDVGVANTIDDAIPAVQYGREQVYLAVKAHAALWALADLEHRCDVKDKDNSVERWRAFASKGIKTIEDYAWLSGHYAVTLTESATGLVDPWTGDPVGTGELKGWDAHSIYTTNGLLYLFMAGIKMPRWRMQRFAADIENAWAATLGPYGCRHCDMGRNSVWFSQNMWRDQVAAYLGIDMLANMERYWDYQQMVGENWNAPLYTDTNESGNLSFYPRGTAAFGMSMSAAGLRLNRLESEITLHPIRQSMRVPLLPLADWKAMRIPVLTVTHHDGVTLARISERDLLDGLTLTLLGAELEPE